MDGWINGRRRAMEMTIGSMFFYGGVAGLVITTLLAILSGILLGRGRKKLRRVLEEEYGNV